VREQRERCPERKHHPGDRRCVERWCRSLFAEQHGAERDLHAHFCGTRWWHPHLDLEHHRQRNVQRRDRQPCDHLHACSDRQRRCERNGLRECCHHHLERIGFRCRRRYLERRNGNLHAEQHHTERDLCSQRCGTYRRNGNAHAHQHGQRSVQRGERCRDLHDLAITNGQRRSGSNAVQQQPRGDLERWLHCCDWRCLERWSGHLLPEHDQHERDLHAHGGGDRER
jgi:hypothetical protein